MNCNPNQLAYYSTFWNHGRQIYDTIQKVKLTGQLADNATNLHVNSSWAFYSICISTICLVGSFFTIRYAAKNPRSFIPKVLSNALLGIGFISIKFFFQYFDLTQTNAKNYCFPNAM